MRKLWNRVPMSLRAGLALSGLLAVLFFLWLCVEWAVPSPILALRLTERQNLFGPGQIVASGTLDLGKDYLRTDDRWYAVRSGDRTAVVTLTRHLGFLWGGIYGRSFRLLDSCPESPLDVTTVASMTRSEENRPFTTARHLLCLSAYDDTVARVDVTMAPSGPSGLSPEARTAWQAEHAVTVAADPVGDRFWTALITLDAETAPAGPWLQAYDAQGNLIYDSIP